MSAAISTCSRCLGTIALPCITNATSSAAAIGQSNARLMSAFGSWNATSPAGSSARMIAATLSAHSHRSSRRAVDLS